MTRLSPPTLALDGGSCCIDMKATAAQRGIDFPSLPRPLRVLLENVILHEGPASPCLEAFKAGAGIATGLEIPFRPGRILTHDTAGIAALVDLAALRDRVAESGGDPRKVTLAVPTDLVVDHSIAVNVSSRSDAAAQNARLDIERNEERYRFLRWAEQAFDRLRIIPPGNGICHQVNMEYLATVAAGAPAGDLVVADTVIGTDSHTTMVNALGVLGWGVGGIEAEAVALGDPLILSLPPVTGCRITGRRRPGVSAADAVLAIARRLRDHGVVAHFVEFFGEGLDGLSLSDRAALANMAPEYGATCGLFPVDATTLHYLRQTGRPPEHVALVESYARAAGLWRDDASQPAFAATLTVDLATLEPVIAGPHRPQQVTALGDVPAILRRTFDLPEEPAEASAAESIKDGDVVLAAITSCTHTANPDLMVAAGILARNARRAGLKTPPHVKTSLSPGSRSVAEYLTASGLLEDLEALGFTVAGFGCMTCAGNSGPLPEPIDRDIRERSVVACGVLSGNRNFEGRIHPQLKACYLASPALVVAYALAGSMLTDLSRDAIGTGDGGQPVRLRDIWPDDAEISTIVSEFVTPASFPLGRPGGTAEPPEWKAIEAQQGPLFAWREDSTFVQRPPFFGAGAPRSRLADIGGARPLLVLGDGVTTDHISPFGDILPGSPAARFLSERGVDAERWSNYAERRGNHEVLSRSAFANPRLRNRLAGDGSGSVTIGPDGAPAPIFEAAQAFQRANTPTVVFAGKQYGTGSARDWAAKATALLGVKAVVAESFERIHRTNLVGLGVLPCELPAGVSVDDLGIAPDTEIAFEGLDRVNGPRPTIRMTLKQRDGAPRTIALTCRLDTEAEVAMVRAGGMFPMAEEAVGVAAA